MPQNLAVAALALLPYCPFFYEFLPDPTDVPDNEGEYIIIKWDVNPVPWDTITLRMDDGKLIKAVVTDTATSLILTHSQIGFALPNSRATVWTLSAGDCRDTAYLPVPKAGKLLVKDENGEWKPASEESPCNSREGGNLECSETTLDSIFFADGIPQLYISEVAPCPEEPVPEWFEVSNRSQVSFPLNGISDCKTKSPLKSTDSLESKQSILITKDSAELRNFLQSDEIKIAQISVSTLKNTADTLRLCVNNSKLDSVMWGKQVNRQIKCPSREKISPGFVPRISTQKSKILEIAERVLSRSKRKNTLKIRWKSAVNLEMQLIDRNGVGLLKKNLETAPEGSGFLEISEWRKCQNGPCFIHIFGDGVNETIPFVVMP
ncbi:hypothetical protein AGMMS49938_03190 [Fibrobacterales bacterium]|nr:hypothetical protein AGMMS49938_03190 [Fibrobacterales bacterium]